MWHDAADDVMTGLDILMIGPFPVDEQRIEGGVQASVYGLCRSLSGFEGIDRIEVVSTPKRVGGAVVRTRLAGIGVTHLTAPYRFMMSSVLHIPAILRLLKRSRRAVVHLHGSGLFELAVLAACRVKRIPIVWTLHGITEKETYEAWIRAPGLASRARHWLYTVCERMQLRLATSLIVDTPYVAREIARRSSAEPAALPQGIFVDELAAARNDRREAPVVMALGVIHPRKGHDLTIEAFARVLERVPDARLNVVGSLTSTEHLSDLHAKAAALGITDRVSIRTDLARGEVLKALAGARVFALHSEEESQGIALCEAMAVGLPIVATSVGGIPDVIGDSGAGVMVDHGDIRGFADHITRLLLDDEAHAAMSRAAARRGADFDWRTIAKGVVERYRLATAGGRNRREVRYPDVRPAAAINRSEPH